MLDGGTLASYSSGNVGRCSSVLSQHKRSHHVCFSRPGDHGYVVFVFNPLAAQRYVLCRQRFSSAVSQVVVGATQESTMSTGNIGRNGPVGVLKRVYQTVPYLPLN